MLFNSSVPCSRSTTRSKAYVFVKRGCARQAESNKEKAANLVQVRAANVLCRAINAPLAGDSEAGPSSCQHPADLRHRCQACKRVAEANCDTNP
jgi:hypothetical protein